MSDDFVCPEGMYPMDVDYEGEVLESLSELQEEAEHASDVLNLPLTYAFNSNDDGEEWFELVFLMPRKYGKTWSLRSRYESREQVLAWLNPWLKQQIDGWFGWEAED